MLLTRRPLTLLLLLITFNLTAQTAKQLNEFDQFIQQGIKDWEIPGMAVVVVKDNKVIFKKGYGVRELGKPEKVDNQTMFVCASTTKAMTAACMGILVDEGKVNWNDHVTDYLPEFRLYDPYVTQELRIRDLFTHNSGVGNADFLWDIMSIRSDEILEKMALVKPTYSFRSSFIYQNIFYLAAGKVIEKVSGQPWSEFIKQKIFTPLGMTRTTPLYAEALKQQNLTSAHFKIEGKIEVISHSNADEIAPAGAVWSSIDDMGKWAMCMLDSSKYQGGRLVSAKTWTELFKPQVVVPADQFYPSIAITKPNWMTYSLGWFQHDYKGNKVNFHTGSLAGAVAIHGQLPSHKLAVYVFENLDHAELRHSILYKTFDLFALGGTRDWNKELQLIYKGIREENEKQEKIYQDARQTNTNPSVSPEKFAGIYSNEILGKVIVTKTSNGLKIDINNTIQSDLTHWHYNTYQGWASKKWWGKINATFYQDAAGKVAIVNIDGYEFTREEDIEN